MIDAADAAFLDPAQGQRGAAMAAILIEHLRPGRRCRGRRRNPRQEAGPGADRSRDGVSSSDSSAGNQKRRMAVPMAVPGPTRHISSLSSSTASASPSAILPINPSTYVLAFHGRSMKVNGNAAMLFRGSSPAKQPPSRYHFARKNIPPAACKEIAHHDVPRKTTN